MQNQKVLLLIIFVICLNVFELFGQNYSIEYKLASIEVGYKVPQDHRLVKRFRTLLNQLDYKYVENRQEIADATVKGKQMLEERGIEEKMENIMEGMNLLFTSDIPNQKYTEYVAFYVVLRDKGMTHKESIDYMKSLLNSLGVY
ncbi:MAG: hypothetical protein H0Z30_09445 [Candidatus Marinimicrobia bacterium]|nr:hypothetical protein [Candidatus Neomarinimicrobiota bacterium]